MLLLLLFQRTVELTWMLFVDERHLRYMKSSVIPIAITFSLFPVLSDIWGLPCLFHSCTYPVCLQSVGGSICQSELLIKCVPYLQVWTFHNWTCTVKAIFIRDNGIYGSPLQLPNFCSCFDLLCAIACCRELLKTVGIWETTWSPNVVSVSAWVSLNKTWNQPVCLNPCTLHKSSHEPPPYTSPFFSCNDLWPFSMHQTPGKRQSHF